MTETIETDSFVQVTNDEGDMFMGLKNSNAFKFLEMHLRLGLAELGEVNVSNTDIVFTGSTVIVETENPYTEYTVRSDGEVLHTTVSNEDGVVSFTTEMLPVTTITVENTNSEVISSFEIVTVEQFNFDDITESVVDALSDAIIMSEMDENINIDEAEEMYYEDETPQVVKTYLNEFACVDPTQVSYLDYDESDLM